mmetsp:Transcript_17161/g.35092  ORF Transcript_17161/g.35092 Transcript_17161/m.35092 type:complete len:189 (-) Transcript_17161:123-689(-)
MQRHGGVRIVVLLLSFAPACLCTATSFIPAQSKSNGGDVFKDTGLRYLGYANELGESFRPLIRRRFVRASYFVAGGYVVADAVDKTRSAFKNHLQKKNKVIDAIDKGLDTLVWQGLASVAIPGYTINRIVWVAGKVKWPGPLNAVVPTVIGLSSIPLIVHPIDEGVHKLMDASLRPAMHALTAPLHAK